VIEINQVVKSILYLYCDFIDIADLAEKATGLMIATSRDDPRRMWLPAFLNIMIPLMVELHADMGDSKEMHIDNRSLAWAFADAMEALETFSAELLADESSTGCKMPFTPSGRTWHALYVMAQRSRSRFPASLACCIHAQTIFGSNRIQLRRLQVHEMKDEHWTQIMVYISTEHIAPISKLPSKALSALIGLNYASAMPGVVTHEYSQHQ
jgi:hypothetical protein